MTLTQERGQDYFAGARYAVADSDGCTLVYSRTLSTAQEFAAYQPGRNVYVLVASEIAKLDSQLPESTIPTYNVLTRSDIDRIQRFLTASDSTVDDLLQYARSTMLHVGNELIYYSDNSSADADEKAAGERMVEKYNKTFHI
jgi:hypothetical protein